MKRMTNALLPAPILLASIWTILLNDYAKSIAEECCARNIRVSIGPGMNIY